MLIATLLMAGLLGLLAEEMADPIRQLGHQGQAGRAIPQVGGSYLHPPSAVPTVINPETLPAVALISLYLLKVLS